MTLIESLSEFEQRSNDSFYLLGDGDTKHSVHGMSQPEPCMNVASDGEEKFSDDELPASIPRNSLDVDISVFRTTGNYSTFLQSSII